MPRNPHILSASHLILCRGEEVLLQRRFQTGWMDGFYSLPAGHIEDGETAMQSLTREIKEELNLTLSSSQLEMAHTMHRLADNDLQYIDFFFLCREWEGEPVIAEPEKCDDLSWFPLSRLPENTVPYIKSALLQYQAKNPYSEFGWKSD